MKKIVFFLFFFISFLEIKGQCSENWMPAGFINFSDTNEELHSLDDYLLSGKIVVVDFYLLTCGSCMGSAPCIETLYPNYGQNTNDVIVLAFDVGSGDSTNEVANEWAEEYGMPNVPNFSQIGGTQNTPGFWGQFYAGCGENGGFAQTYVLTANLCCGDPSALNYETGCYAYCGDNTCCTYNENDSPPIQGVTYAHQGGVLNCSAISDHIDSLLADMLNTNQHQQTHEKTVVKTINILGQSTKDIRNTILFNIYNDGSVEKIYNTNN